MAESIFSFGETNKKIEELSAHLGNIDTALEKTVPSDPPDSSYGTVSNLTVSYSNGTWYLNISTPASQTMKRVALTNV